jgi:hypothetical protein
MADNPRFAKWRKAVTKNVGEEGKVNVFGLAEKLGRQITARNVNAPDRGKEIFSKMKQGMEARRKPASGDSPFKLRP